MGVRAVLLAGIGFYSRAISPALPPRCRFQPTCSAYAAEAITHHGAARGTWLALRRLLKCAPWHPGGIDFVPGTVPAPGETSGTPGAVRPSGTAKASPPSRPVVRRPDMVTRPLATPSHRRRADEESSVA
jgi:putative membrane protein insertion efficiency factor